MTTGGNRIGKDILWIEFFDNLSQGFDSQLGHFFTQLEKFIKSKNSVQKPHWIIIKNHKNTTKCTYIA